MTRYRQYTTIPGFAGSRIPRLGKIHLGIKVDDGRSYPKEVDYFVCPDEIQAVYGKTPTELEVVFPVDTIDAIAPFAFKKYGKRGLICKGDGQTYGRTGPDGTMTEGDCPCPDDCPYAKNDKEQIVCKAIMNLQVVVFKVNVGGVYQIDTSSWNSITNVVSGLEYVQNLFGRIAGIPLILSRVPKETQYQGKKAIHYVLSLTPPSHARAKMLTTEVRTILGDLNALTGPHRSSEAMALPAPDDNDLPTELIEAKVVEAAQATLHSRYQHAWTEAIACGWDPVVELKQAGFDPNTLRESDLGRAVTTLENLKWNP